MNGWITKDQSVEKFGSTVRLLHVDCTIHLVYGYQELHTEWCFLASFAFLFTTHCCYQFFSCSHLYGLNTYILIIVFDYDTAYLSGSATQNLIKVGCFSLVNDDKCFGMSQCHGLIHKATWDIGLESYIIALNCLFSKILLELTNNRCELALGGYPDVLDTIVIF